MPKNPKPTRRVNRATANSVLAAAGANSKPLPVPVPEQIHRLFEKQQRLYAQDGPSPAALEELAYTNREWEQCWELWCQDEALIRAGQNADGPRPQSA